MKKTNKAIESPLIQQAAINIRILRLQKGLSQEDLAELSGYHRTYIGSVERGERNITLTTLESLASTLNIEPSKLLEG
ncbi:helix-turn-helix domain-containing protein [Bermanella sp. WJH001]|uniref:helix-turn-helix domain-containing protein n=1 Tax=Bermanella sp. WJH001 TaxID=3048005 RepID=UPI0024BE7672|nr:helix-turn-helix transcriptional regulator [Bermanella sp. WJH001]MDJ1538937.1 helix-turn-helix transcriptional regulator [Bermanella sp. WJH001]